MSDLPEWVQGMVRQIKDDLQLVIDQMQAEDARGEVPEESKADAKRAFKPAFIAGITMTLSEGEDYEPDEQSISDRHHATGGHGRFRGVRRPCLRGIPAMAMGHGKPHWGGGIGGDRDARHVGRGALQPLTGLVREEKSHGLAHWRNCRRGRGGRDLGGQTGVGPGERGVRPGERGVRAPEAPRCPVCDRPMHRVATECRATYWE